MDALERWREQPGMEDAKLILVCHSMGGLVARWFAECEGGAGHIRAIVTIGTPHRGSVKALGTLVNGLTPGLGPLRLSLTRFARSLPSLYQLLPQYDCMVTESGRCGVRDASCPNLSTAMLDDANAFHTSLDVAPSYVLHKVVGIRQPTFTTAGVRGDEVELFEDIDGLTQGGDGTVARLAAEPVHTRGHEVHEVANQHGELQGDRSVLDLVDGILTREDLVWQSGAVEGFGVRMDDVVPVGVPVPLQVTSLGDRRLWVTVHDESGAPWGQPVLVRPDGLAMLGPFPEGGYRAVVAPRKPGRQPTVTRPFLAFDGHA
jgi:hypothetical protein